MRRDGVVLAYGGGQAVPSLMPDEQSIGQKCEILWPQHVAEVIKRLMLAAIASRASSEASFQHLGLNHEARVSAQGPDRALCVIRRVMTGALEEALESSDVRARPMLDRRGFLRRFKDSMSLAALCEKPAAVAVIHVDGVTEIAQAFDSTIAEQIMSAAIRRLSPPEAGPESEAW